MYVIRIFNSWICIFNSLICIYIYISLSLSIAFIYINISIYSGIDICTVYIYIYLFIYLFNIIVCIYTKYVIYMWCTYTTAQWHLPCASSYSHPIENSTLKWAVMAPSARLRFMPNLSGLPGLPIQWWFSALLAGRPFGSFASALESWNLQRLSYELKTSYDHL